MNYIINIASAFLLLGIVEAVIKPVAKRFTQRKLLRFTPHVLRALDHQLPELLQTGNGQTLDNYVRLRFEALTGESWANANLAPFWEAFDPRATADVLRNAQPPNPQ
jgi:hypothetical protein